MRETVRRHQAPPPGPSDAPPQQVSSADFSPSARLTYWVPNLHPGPAEQMSAGEKFGGHPWGLATANRPECPECNQPMLLRYQGSKVSAGPAGSTLYLFGCCQHDEVVIHKARPGKKSSQPSGPQPLPELLDARLVPTARPRFPGHSVRPTPGRDDWPAGWSYAAKIAAVQLLWEAHPGPDHPFTAPGSQGMYTIDWLPRPDTLVRTPQGLKYRF